MRQLLLDTHAWVWSLTGDSRLSPAAIAAMERAETVSISVITLFEIGQKVRLGKWPEMEPFLDRLVGLADEQGGRLLTLTPDASLLAATLEWLPASLAFMLGAVAMVATGCVDINRAYREIDVPGGLHVELTETAAVHNLEACSELMMRLRRLGCPIALDDFGSGMSSFTYLRNLPIDYLKIDSAFIRQIAADPIDHAMVETIQRIAGIMGMRTVAEGVETAEVLDALSLIGVDFAQGNWVRRAVPLVQIPTLVGSGGQGSLHSRNDAARAFSASAPAR